MTVRQEELRARTKQFALRIIRVTRSLPENTEGRVLGKQLLRSGTSVAANYRAAGRARSRTEFAARMGIVVEETDETVFWLELIRDAGIIQPELLAPLMDEANQLLGIFGASYRTLRAKPTQSGDTQITR